LGAARAARTPRSDGKLLWSIPTDREQQYAMVSANALILVRVSEATRGFATMAAYLVVGGLGVGVFAANSSGWDVLRLSSATGGYLVGMLVAASLVGWLADRGWDRHAVRSLPAMVLGNIVIYAFGATWLAHALGLSASQAWHLGVQPFLWGDAVKILLAAGLLPLAWKVVDEIRR
jgi:biotin transport system substrate-specific component